MQQFFAGAKQTGNCKKKHALLFRLGSGEILRSSAARPECANVRRADGQNRGAPTENNTEVTMTRGVPGDSKQGYIGDSIRKLVEQFSGPRLATAFDGHQAIQQVRKES
jgi:hypothetical protein